jgi:hypothetical protein
MADIRVTALWRSLIEMAAATGATNINKLPGCFVHKFGEYTAYLNGTDGDQKPDGAPLLRPFDACVMWDWIPIAHVGPADGIVSHKGDDSLIAAIQAETDRLRAGVYQPGRE